MDLDKRFHDAVQEYWNARKRQQQKQLQHKTVDAGKRSEVTGGSQMGALQVLVVDILRQAGLDELHIKSRLGLELPGYFRPEKKWDLLVVSRAQLVCALEFKSQVGPSFGNNVNNRAEEAIGNAVDIWTAYREGLLGSGPRPFLGYFFLLEDCDKIHKQVRVTEPHFPVDPIFRGASYARRYELLCRRLVLERHYEAACLTLATNETPTRVSHPSGDLTFARFAAELEGTAVRFLRSTRA